MKTGQAMPMLLLLLTPPAFAEPASDPWAGVPALPTACYRGNDTFDDRADAAAEPLAARSAEQEEINSAIEQQYGQVDIMELQQRMMTLMMENPDQAQRYLETMQQGGQQVQELTPELAERAGQLETELQELTATYDADLRQAMDPIENRRQSFRSSTKKCNDASLAKEAAFNAEQNRAYGGLCDKWWKTGPFHEWFGRYKQFKTEEAAHWVEHSESAKLTYETVGIEADNYRSTEDLKAPIEYMSRASRVFFKREYGPVSEELGSCDGHG